VTIKKDNYVDKKKMTIKNNLGWRREKKFQKEYIPLDDLET
jgi:hypothetical protein